MRWTCEPINITTIHHIIIGKLARASVTPAAIVPPTQFDVCFGANSNASPVNGVDTLKMEIIHGCLRPIVGVTQWVYEIYIDTAEIIESLLWKIWISNAARECGKTGRVPLTDIYNGSCLRSFLYLLISTHTYVCTLTNLETSLETVKKESNKEISWRRLSRIKASLPRSTAAATGAWNKMAT